MSASQALLLRKQRRAICEKMGVLLDSKEPNAMVEWKALQGQADTLGVQIEQIESDILQRAEVSANGRGISNRELPNVTGSFTPDPFMDLREFVPGEARDRGRIAEIRSARAYAADFDNYLRTGEISARQRELRAIGAATGADGATLVPQGFEQELETALKYWAGLSNICRSITTATGNPLPWPTMDDTANSGEWLAEAAGVGSADPTFSNVTLGANLLSSKQVKVSVALEQDSAFPIAQILSDAFGERLGRTLDTALWTGDGSTIPITGLLTALQTAGGRSVLAVGANANDGSSTDLNSVGTDDFAGLIDKLDRAYQKSTNRFVFNQSTLNAVRKLKDKYGRPVFETSLAMGDPTTIYGYPFQVDNAFANIGAGNVSVAFGDFSKYVIRRALGFTLVRFNELYMPNYQRAYQAFMRVDAKLLQSRAFSYLTHPLS